MRARIETVEMDFDVATEYPSTAETVREDICSMIKDKFGDPLELAKYQHHRLSVRVIVEDRGWVLN